MDISVLIIIGIFVGLAILISLIAIARQLSFLSHVVLIEFDKQNDRLFVNDVCQDCQHE